MTLCWVGLVFSSSEVLINGTRVRWIYRAVLAPQVRLQLPDRLQKRKAFDVADRAADLDDGHVGVVGDGQDVPLDFIRDVGDDLHGPAQVVSAALLVDHGKIDLAGGEIVAAVEAGRGEPFVVPEIQVRLRPVVEDEDLPVLEGVHGPGVHVDVGIQLLIGHPEAPALQERADGGRGQALSQRGKHPAGDENKLRSSR